MIIDMHEKHDNIGIDISKMISQWFQKQVPWKGRPARVDGGRGAAA